MLSNLNEIRRCWPSENLVPQRYYTEASGDVFDIDVDILGETALVATRSGMLVEFEVPTETTNAMQSKHSRVSIVPVNSGSSRRALAVSAVRLLVCGGSGLGSVPRPSNPPPSVR